MVVQEHDDTTVEFTNIQREELGVLNEYIHQVLIPAMQADTKEGAKGTIQKESGDNDVDVDVDDDSSTEDEGNAEMEDDTDDEDANFVDGDEEEGEADVDVEEDEDSDDDEDEGDDFEVVDDDFAKELTKNAKGKPSHDEPRASRSSKRRGSPTVQEVAEIAEEDVSVADDDDFEVVQAASSTESEGDDDSASGSPTKKSRH
jgi:hypothetical protein